MEEFNLFVWLTKKAGLGEYLNEWIVAFFGSFFVLLIIVVISLLFWTRLKKAEDVMVPSGGFSLRNVLEVGTDGLLKIMREIMGEKAERFLPLIGTLFIYIFCCNIMGFIPGFISPTTVITTNLACALVVFVYYNYIGIRENGFKGYLKHFLGPVIWLAPLFLVVELTTHLVRIVSLSVRLYGNMMGDHLVLGIFSSLVPVLIPIFFIILGLFISFLQAFIFAILSTVYIALAVEH